MFSIVFDIVEYPLAPDLSLAILHLGIYALPRNVSIVLINLLLSAKLTISRWWNSSQSPSVIDTVTTPM